MSVDLSDYVEVKDRLARFHEKFPEGSLQSNWKVAEIGEQTLIVAEARAYRTPDDKRPGEGMASEPFPGKTPYTRDSELMNAETSAWGRALAALGFEVSRAIRSREEVSAREGNGAAPQRADPKPPANPLPEARVNELGIAIGKVGVPFDRLCLLFGSVGADAPRINRSDSLRKALTALTPEQADKLDALIAQEAARG